jgi:hypothetical protein
MRNRCCRLAAALGMGLALFSACTSPTEPDPFVDPPPGRYQSLLIAVSGTGAGGMSVNPVANAAGIFVGTMRFRVRAKPNTTYKVMRAADVARAGNDDGVCQRAEGAPPWGDGPAFVQFPFPFPGDPLVMTTDSRGEGSLDYEYESPQILRGYRFDVRMRLVDDENAPTSDLRSRCMTIEVL